MLDLRDEFHQPTPRLRQTGPGHPGDLVSHSNVKSREKQEGASLHPIGITLSDDDSPQKGWVDKFLKIEAAMNAVGIFSYGLLGGQNSNSWARKLPFEAGLGGNFDEAMMKRGSGWFPPPEHWCPLFGEDPWGNIHR